MKSAVRHLRQLLSFLKRPRDPAEFERMFQHFRQVLDSNNRSLEIITEMGDVLGGDYLFDIQYLRRAYGQLHANLGSSLLHFDRLTGGRYRELSAVHDRLDRRIRQVLEGSEEAAPELILPLGRVNADLAASTGAKNGNLGELKNRLNLDVPEGFVLTTRAFDAFLRHNHIPIRISADDGAAPDETAKAVLRGELPPELRDGLEKALRKLRSRCGRECSLAIRSSAGEEDGEFSFAGQYRTVLSVPPELSAVEKAYKQVLASLYSLRAAAYRRRLGVDPAAVKMAVGCLVLVDAETSGVLFTADPNGGNGRMLIASAWGLGTTVVDGRAGVDHFVVRKAAAAAMIEQQTGSKETMTVRRPGGGIEEVPTPQEKRTQPSLTQEQIDLLARTGLAIEQHFHRPQDVEWAFDRNGRLVLLQSRPLRIAGDTSAAAPPKPGGASDAAPIGLRSRGLPVQKGAAFGRVFVVRNSRELDKIPRGAVLVAKHDSSNFVRVMTDLAAIITDAGSPASHMAALSREFRLPTAVNAGDATRTLRDGQEVTVAVDDSGVSIYPGRAEAVLAASVDRSLRLEDLYEYRKKRYLLRSIAGLNLIDPLRDDFSPAACKTLHDVLRFIHEKSVLRLIDGAGGGSGATAARRLDLSVPAGLAVIDIGGGLKNDECGERLSMDQVASLPLRAVAGGMTHPGAWRSEPVPLGAGDFLASMFHAPDITATGADSVNANIAVVTAEYANIHLKFGYHFIVLDCYASDTARNNHIYFRFAGGATDLTKRSRRLQLIGRILAEYGLSVVTRGDLIVARISNVARPEMEELLDSIGRLISYTRQLDAVLVDDRSVAMYAKRFLQGIYGFAGTEGGR